MRTMLTLFLLLILTTECSTQICFDSLIFKNDRTRSCPSQKFIDDTRGFFRFAKEKAFSKIDTSCKGGDFAKQSLKRLTDGFKDTFLMKGLKMYLVDSYSLNKDLNVNFALMEILFSSAAEAKKACRLFKSKKLLFTDALFRAYRPQVRMNRLLIYYTASIADKDLAEYYASIGIRKFLDEE